MRPRLGTGHNSLVWIRSVFMHANLSGESTDNFTQVRPDILNVKEPQDVLCCAVLSSNLLCCAVLCCNLLCCAVLSRAMPCWWDVMTSPDKEWLGFLECAVLFYAVLWSRLPCYGVTSAVPNCPSPLWWGCADTSWSGCVLSGPSSVSADMLHSCQLPLA